MRQSFIVVTYNPPSYKQRCIQMAELQVVIADPKEGKSYQTKVEKTHLARLVGLRIGDEIDGIFVGLPGYKLVITGGSDIDGFPMKKGIPGPGRKKIMGKGGIGFKSNPNNIRMKKMVRGNTISQNIAQLNMKVTEYGPRNIPDLFESGKGDN